MTYIQKYIDDWITTSVVDPDPGFFSNTDLDPASKKLEVNIYKETFFSSQVK